MVTNDSEQTEVTHIRTYIQFKTSMIVSDYVKNSTNRYKRSILAKFRSGILQLRIESGRYSNTKVEERLCELCNLNEVEDEFHFLCKCPYLTNCREEL